MPMLRLLLMLAAVGGFIVAYRLRRQRDPRATRLLQISGVGSAALALWSLAATLLSGGTAGRVTQREDDYILAGVATLAAHVAPELQGKSVAIVQPPALWYRQETMDAMVLAVRQNLGPAGDQAKLIDPDAPGPTNASPPAAGAPFSAARLDALLWEHAQRVDAVILLCGLPPDAQKMKFWSARQKPRLVVWRGAPSQVSPRLKSGEVLAAVVSHPKPVTDARTAPARTQEAFDHRYLLLTPQRPEP